MNIIRKRIKIHDNQRSNLHDCFGTSPFAIKRNRVVVQTRDKNTGKLDLVDDTHNLIVYHGRSWLAQRAVNLNLGMVNTEGSPWDSSSTGTPVVREHYRDMYINWLAVGINGAPSETPMEPNNTYSSDYALGNQCYIYNSGSAGTGNLLYDSKHYHKIDDSYPQFIEDTDVTTEPPDDETSLGGYGAVEGTLYGAYKADSYLKVLYKTTLGLTECNGPNGSSQYDINEAALFVSPSHDPNNEIFTSHETDMVQMFAKVNFSTVRKNANREIIFSWYLYF